MSKLITYTFKCVLYFYLTSILIKDSYSLKNLSKKKKNLSPKHTQYLCSEKTYKSIRLNKSHLAS